MFKWFGFWNKILNFRLMADEDGGGEPLDAGSMSPDEMMSLQHSAKEQPPEIPAEGDGTPAEGEEGKAEGNAKPAEGSETESGQGQAEKSGDVAKPDDKAPTDWTDEDKAYLKSKNWDLPFAQKNVYDSYREAEKNITQAHQTIAQGNGTMAEIANIMHTGDVKALQQLAEGMGATLPIDARTADDRIKEFQDNYDTALNAIDPVFKRMNQLFQQNAENPAAQDAITAIWKSLDGQLVGMQNTAKDAIGKIEQKKLIRDETRSALGISKTSNNLYEKRSANAETNYAELRKHDPKADEAIDAVKEIFVGTKENKSAAEAAGVFMNQLFGHNYPLAQQMVQIGHALNVQKSLNDGSLEKAMIDKYKAEGGEGGKGLPPGQSHVQGKTRELTSYQKATLAAVAQAGGG